MTNDNFICGANFIEKASFHCGPTGAADFDVSVQQSKNMTWNYNAQTGILTITPLSMHLSMSHGYNAYSSCTPFAYCVIGTIK